ncbi:MAG: hypothetical protein M3167_17230 [Acidobacteriota bacterium]|nr:hypothetical protein [Acidobacteriota bacterium]
MRTPQGGSETVWLDPAVLLDRSGVATADVERGPDGSPQIRLGLTPDGVMRLTEIASDRRGKRLGVIVAGKLRAAPYVTGAPTRGVFVIAGVSAADAEEIARSLGPPAPPPTAAMAAMAAAAPPNPRRGAAIPELQGRWRVVEASMNGRPIPDRKITASSWLFRGSELALTNGEGQSTTFSITSEERGVLHIEPAGGSSEKGGWILWSRDKQELLLAFQDNLEGRPDGMQPGPKKVLARLSSAPAGSR